MALAYFGSKIQCQDARQRQEQRVHSAIGIIFGCEKRRQPARAPQPRKARPSPWPRKVHLRTLWRSIASGCFDGNRSPPTVVGLEEYMRTLWTTAALGLMLTACKGEGGLEGLGIAEPAKVEQKQAEVMGKIARATSSEIQLENHPQPVKVDSSTQVTLDGRTASADQIRPGTQVRVSIRTEAGETRATRIEAKTD